MSLNELDRHPKTTLSTFNDPCTQKGRALTEHPCYLCKVTLSERTKWPYQKHTMGKIRVPF